MGTEAWITTGVTAAMVLVMAMTRVGPDMVLMAGVTVLLSAGIVDTAAAFQGFANPAVLTIAALFVVAQGMEETGATDVLARRVLGRPRFLAGAQLRMMLPVSGMSAFLNNTPVVAMMIPIVNDWARRMNISASMLLLPLSYAAILGGTCTLIGTSTNLVVAGMAVTRDPSLSFGMFDITWLGIPAVIVGTTYVVIASRWLLTERKGGAEVVGDPREYTVRMRVEDGSPIVGQTIEQAGLRALPGLFLAEIERGGELIPSPRPTRRVRAGDLLMFAGIIDSVKDLRKVRGLTPMSDEGARALDSRPGRVLVEAVIAPQSLLVGETIRDSQFRSRFGAAVIAVHRQGRRIDAKVGDIALDAGDVVLLDASPTFLRDRKHDGNFALVAEVDGSTEPRHDRAWIAALILLAMVAVNAAGLVDLLVASLVAAGLMLVTRCLTSHQARRSLELRVLMAVASAFGIGAALDQSGAAAAIGSAIVGVATPFGHVGLLAAIYAATALLAGVISTTAAAALMFPIAAAAAEGAGMPIQPTCFVLMIAASTAFSTPIGYQTNLMVYNTGGYHFLDFVKIGLPLQVLVMLSTVTTTWLVFL